MSGAAPRRRIGDVFVEAGLLSPEQLDEALAAQRDPSGPRRRLGQVVVDLGMATERQVAECVAQLLGLEMVDLSQMVPAPDVVRSLPRAVAERTRVLVLDRVPEGLVIATADPTNVLALDDVRLYTRSPDLIVKIATDSQIRDQLNRAWSISQDSTVAAELGEEEENEGGVDPSMSGVDDDAPIVKLVSQILGDAVRLRASDIHIEVQRETLRVRYRIDGMLRDVMNAPKRIAQSVISRVKIISGLDIAERRVPQDGRTRFVVEDIAVDARISTLPSLHGEKVVIRLLSRGDTIPPLKDLGFEPDQLAKFESALAVPQGLILITGPTGSGKTNTLYSAIAQIQNPDRNFVTLEDPVEVQLPGITQVGINEKAGMTFTKGLRSILRQDPDIILVGEVRDSETAELALKASITGHMVLTTLHTNSAAAALTRLIDMGCEPFLVASSLTAAVAQRLVRRVCKNCVQPYMPDDDTLALLGLSKEFVQSGTPMKGAGCPECGGTGYRGRTAVYEVLEVDAPMRRVLMREPTETAVDTQARIAGMANLRASGIDKARRGITTYEEIMRVTHSDHEEGVTCPACERPVEDGMVSCPWCGTALDTDKCPGCAKTIDPEWKMCPWCRTALERKPQQEKPSPLAAIQSQTNTASQGIPVIAPQAAMEEPLPSQPGPPAAAPQTAGEGIDIGSALPQWQDEAPATPQPAPQPSQPFIPAQATPEQTSPQSAPQGVPVGVAAGSEGPTWYQADAGGAAGQPGPGAGSGSAAPDQPTEPASPPPAGGYAPPPPPPPPRRK